MESYQQRSNEEITPRRDIACALGHPRTLQMLRHVVFFFFWVRGDAVGGQHPQRTFSAPFRFRSTSLVTTHRHPTRTLPSLDGGAPGAEATGAAHASQADDESAGQL